MAIEVRAELKEDSQAIEKIVQSAFNRESEARLVATIRDREQALISLVAEIDGMAVGHLLISPIEIMPTTEGSYGAIGPLSVLPDFQRSGIGSCLMIAAIDRSKMLGLQALFLLGSPEYYPRFRFRPSRIDNEYGATDAFMELELEPGVLDTAAGTAKYVSAFQEAGT